MPLYYALVARGETVLAEHYEAQGNFITISRVILGKIPPVAQKKSYIYDRYVFHYMVADGLTFLCMADKDDANMTVRTSFAFLQDIHNRFVGQFGAEAPLSAGAFQMNDEFARVLKSQMHYYMHDPSASKIQQVRQQIDETKAIMVENIDKVLERGEKIELLVDKTDELNSHAQTFHHRSNKLKRAMWWKNMKLYLIIGAVALVVVAIIVLVIVLRNRGKGGSPPSQPAHTSAPTPLSTQARRRDFDNNNNNNNNNNNINDLDSFVSSVEENARTFVVGSFKSIARLVNARLA